VKAWALLLLILCLSVRAESVTLTITNVDIPTATPIIQVEPDPSNTNYFGLNEPGHYWLSGTANFWAWSGTNGGSNFVQISWQTRTNNSYLLQWSTNGTAWFDVRVYFAGLGTPRYWYDWPTNGRSWRVISLAPVAPQNLRVVSK
jgi:hypothetical protein